MSRHPGRAFPAAHVALERGPERLGPGDAVWRPAAAEPLRWCLCRARRDLYGPLPPGTTLAPALLPRLTPGLQSAGN